MFQVLDIGCNVGFLTLKLAKDMGPKWILGIDIDEYLVRVANRNTRQYVDRQQVASFRFFIVRVQYGSCVNA